VSLSIARVTQLPFWVRGLFFVGISAVLLTAGLRAQPIPEAFSQQDKLHHLVGFFALAFSCRLAFLQVKLHWIALGCLLARLCSARHALSASTPV